MKEARITLPEGCKASNARVDGNILSYDVVENTKEMAELNIAAYVARDKNDGLFLYIKGRPKKDKQIWSANGEYNQIDKSLFPSVKWEDDKPTKVRIKIETI